MVRLRAVRGKSGQAMAPQAERSARTIDAILASARRLFVSRGFEAVSIDDIAESAGIAKGGIYHHFRSKRDVFEATLDAVQGELASELEARISANKGKRTPQTIAANILAYLEAATEPGYRRLLLVDGPVVLGWRRWREIDDRHFMASIRSGLVAVMPAGTSADNIDSATSLIAGAAMEAALDCGATADPLRTARRHCRNLEKMLCGLRDS